MAKAYEREMSRWSWDFIASKRQIKINRAGDDAEEIIHRCSSDGYISSEQIDILMESFQQPASARAALLALADCELPDHVVGTCCSINEHATRQEFRAIIRSIATGGEE